MLSPYVWSIIDTNSLPKSVLSERYSKTTSGESPSLDFLLGDKLKTKHLIYPIGKLKTKFHAFLLVCRGPVASCLRDCLMLMLASSRNAMLSPIPIIHPLGVNSKYLIMNRILAPPLFLLTSIFSLANLKPTDVVLGAADGLTCLYE